MEKWLSLLFALLLCIPVYAEQQTAVLGHMPDNEYIHQYMAPNGQLLWFTAREKEPYIKHEDVNFDGAQDIVIFVIRGASNFFTVFYLYDEQADMYTLATHPGDDNGICNYVLHPELGILESQANNGSAGAEHEYRLYRWVGTELKCIRTALSESLVESTHSDDTYTRTTYTDMLHMTVRDYHQGDWESSVVWETVITLEEEEFHAAHEEEMAAFWQGLK